MLAAIVIDGQKLKEAREAKGQSIAELAASLTLSNEQVKYIEDGGDKPFYTPAHKLLAVRKYANALGIPYDEVVKGEGADLTLAAPDEAPPAMHVHAKGQPEVAADLRLAAVTRNSQIRLQLMIFGVILCLILVVYAKVRASYEEAGQTQEQNAEAVGMPVYVSNAETNADGNKPVVTPAAVVLKETAPVAAVPASGDANCPQVQTGAEIKSWSPSYIRKPETRLYVMNPQGGSLCIADASGNAKRINLKPMMGQFIPGKPPFTVSSDKLSQFEMYLQGLRVKVPDEINALRLLPTQNALQQPSDQPPAQAPEL